MLQFKAKQAQKANFYVEISLRACQSESLWHIWKFSCESHFWKPLSKENFHMWHTHLRKFLLAKVNFQE